MQVGMKDLPYKVEQRSFVVRAAASPMAFIVPQNSPWKTLKDVAGGSEERSGQPHLDLPGRNLGRRPCHEAVLRRCGHRCAQNEDGNLPRGLACLQFRGRGHVQLGAATAGTILPLVSGGNARCIAVTSTERLKELPDGCDNGPAGASLCEYSVSGSGFQDLRDFQTML